jgi:hypothetical protein
MMAAAGPDREWDFNDIARRVTLDTIGGWGFGADWNVGQV